MIHYHVMVGRRQDSPGLAEAERASVRGAMAITYPQEGSERPTAEVASSAIAKIPEASDGAQPNGRNAPPKPECNLESTTSRIAHAVGRPIAKAGETGIGAQPDSGNEPPKPGSADLGCTYAALRVKKCNPRRSLEAETPRPLTACWITLPSQPGLSVTKSELLHCRSVVACNLPVYSAPQTKEFAIFDWDSLRWAVLGQSEGVIAEKNRQNGQTKPLHDVESTT